MKLVPKLTMMFILSMSAALGVNGYLRVRREVGLFESDRVRDHQLMASVIARAALAVWKTDGPERAVTMVDELGSKQGKLKISWLPLDAGNTPELRNRLQKLQPGLAAVLALLSGILGLRLVGKPVAALSQKARRIGGRFV